MMDLQIVKTDGKIMVSYDDNENETLVPCPFTGPKIFCARPKVYLHIVAVTNILC